MGVLIRIARLDVGADGAVASAELARLTSMGENHFDMFQSMMLNWSVVFSLLLTIYISMAVLHSGGYAYVEAPEALFSPPTGLEGGMNGGTEGALPQVPTDGLQPLTSSCLR